MKRIFILTGEPSGDKLASTDISKLKTIQPDIEYLSVGGNHLKSLGINSIFNLKEIRVSMGRKFISFKLWYGRLAFWENEIS